MYLALFRKIATLGTPKFQVPYKSPINGTTMLHTMSVEELEIEDLNVPSLPVKLTFKDGQVFNFGPLTVGDVLKLLEKNKLKDATCLMAAQVRNIEFDAAHAYLHSVSNNDDLSNLGEVERLLAHNIKPIQVQCTEKDKNDREVTNTVTIRLEGRQALLLPFREEEYLLDLELVLGREINLSPVDMQVMDYFDVICLEKRLAKYLKKDEK